MIKAELYNRTVDILYQAYFNDDLEHGDCCACAVGNIVAANCGFRLKRNKKGAGLPFYWVGQHYPGHTGWGLVFTTRISFIDNTKFQELSVENYFGQARVQIDSTGYELHQLAKIEFAFESADEGESEEDYMFNGLVAVLEVLKQIHQITDEDEINNDRFKEQYNKRLAVAK